MICFDYKIGIHSLFTNFLYNYAHCGSIITIFCSFERTLNKVYNTFMNFCEQYKTSPCKVLALQV